MYEDNIAAKLAENYHVKLTHGARPVSPSTRRPSPNRAPPQTT
jgi:hypothetical protein